MSTRAGFGLRPRSLGELLDLTFRVYRARFVPLAIVGVLTSVANLFLSIVFQALLAGNLEMMESDPGEFLSRAMTGFLFLIPGAIVVQVAGSLPMFAIARDAIEGTGRSARSLATEALGRILPALVTALLAVLLIVPGLVLCVLPGIVVSLGLVLATPLVYFERRGPLVALVRSWNLVYQRGRVEFSAESNVIRVLVIGVVSVIVWYALSIVSSIPQAAVQSVSVMRGHPIVDTALGPQPLPLAIMLPVYFIGAIFQGVFLPITVVPWAVVYLDIRTRHEGLDLDLEMQRIRAAGAAS